ncbi:hypothetical protein ZYGR_0AD00320 [Zygosaccharomyces rouxii]|uniref:Autophagy-related protein 32 n=2 Tax=Zygosaccharomyces rouxii TaxID=4956 RepID=ATG32_ZYGRC|nr:uncharacterized protein ZYRO0G06666g [Zygosaccharomyces rouxii]C5DZR8.1 RecName: Full=Autophagy-related protein 32 [Zygosaccharomyces rouxii CBS 732]KAH9202350.1 autophagy-related protein 32 [Zygosaccharomyces rouxii]GAV50849.1 hypothetical protein ZYGR_0AD00320 [Zygosaccharomyces rouxii]CAR29352.1 ZYRO0G06666p [Zygosaccharomyces rouxii]
MTSTEGTGGGDGKGISGFSDIERRSILDPHLSVLELLRRPSDTRPHEALKGEVSDIVGNCAGTTGTGNGSISQSWQTIHRNDSCLSVVPERCPSQATAAGILSSSDTSEDEPDAVNSPSAVHQQLHATPPQKHTKSLEDYRSLNVGIPLVLPEDSNNINNNNKNGSTTGSNGEEDDNDTITKSLNSSSNSFIMPKLSLSQKTQKFRILVLGRPGLKFYHSIPKKYQHMFELPRSHDPAEFKQYTGILVVFQELKEMVSLLNRVCQCNPNRPVIPVCQSGQRQQVRNLLESLLKNRLVSLLYPPVVVNNQPDLLGMFRFLQELSKTVSDNSDMDAEEPNNGSKRLKRSLQRKKKKFIETSAERNGRPHKKRHNNEKVNRWVLWGVSLTLGVGVGYCISHLVSSTWISLTTNPLGPVDPESVSKDLFVFDRQELKLGEMDMDSDHPFGHALFLFKQALKQWNLAVKQFLGRHLSCMERIGPANCLEWPTSDEHTNRVLALGYVML